jgi:large subunit ribosomal protein L15
MTLKVHHLRPAPGAKTVKTRKGRGEASKGKTAGRGGKGTRARNQVRAGFEGGQLPLVMRLPKLRGFKNPATIEYQAVNVVSKGWQRHRRGFGQEGRRTQGPTRQDPGKWRNRS